MEIWRCLPFQHEPIAMQLSIGDGLLAGLEKTGTPALCWYQTSSTSLVLGRGQSQAEIDQQQCLRAGITVHRRSSGGTAILIEPNLLMLDVAIPKHHHLHISDMTESYRWFGEIWKDTLHMLGINAHMLSVAESRNDTASINPIVRRVCFGGFSPYEVVVEGKKIVGLAQVRRRNGAVFQAGIYWQWKPQRLVPLLHLQPDEQTLLETALLARTTGLNEHWTLHGDERTNKNYHRASYSSAIIATFASVLRLTMGIELVEDSWMEEEYQIRYESVQRYTSLLA